jgi:hypothetical protein
MFKYKGSNASIMCAVEEANDLIISKEFLTPILDKESFDMADCDGVIIAQLIDLFASGMFGDLTVKTYKSKNPWSKAYGYFNPSKPDQIYLNTRNLNRPIASIIASLVHEMLHFLDSKSVFSFGHGDNSSTGKGETAPYWIDNLAENILKTYVFSTYNSGGNIYTPWYYRLWAFVRGK